MTNRVRNEVNANQLIGSEIAGTISLLNLVTPARFERATYRLGICFWPFSKFLKT